MSFERVKVTYDGDRTNINRGELRFAWRYDGQTLGERSETKMKDGSGFSLVEHNEVVQYLGDDDKTKRISMWGGERDATILGFCEAPVVGFECKGIWWISADLAPIDLADIAAMPLCAEYGFEGSEADDRCTEISTPGNWGYRYPRFNVIVRFDMD
jgi:hypothetical protein